MSQNSQANFKNLTACGASMSDHFGTLDIKMLTHFVPVLQDIPKLSEAPALGY